MKTGAALRLMRLAPNPAGGCEALHAVVGDVVHKVPARLEDTGEALAPAARPARRLRLFHVNDLHNHLYDEDETGAVTHRLAEMAATVAQARAEAGPDEAVLFLSAGDDHTGTPLDELVGWGRDSFVLDPGYRALSAAGVDAATLGNHEFDRGAGQLALGAGEATFALLSANLHGSAHLHAGSHFHPAVIARVKGLRVGIVGLTTRVETRTGQPADPGMAVASPVETLRRLLPLVAPVADVVIILSHCGYGTGAHASGKASVARDIGEADFALADLAGALTDTPTVIVGAHTHTRLNEVGLEPENLRAGVLIAQAEANGRFLGEIVIDPAAKSPPAPRLIEIGTRPLTEGARAFARAHVEPLRARVASLMEEVIGIAEGDALGWEATRTSRYAGECALANFMNDTMVDALAKSDDTRVDLAFMNGGSLLAGVAPGPLTFGQWFRVMPYSDEVFITEMSGADLERLLDNNAARLLRPEELATTDTEGFVARGFVHVSGGLRYRIKLGANAAEARAVDIRLEGQPIAEARNRRLRIAMTTYLALGSFGERWNGAPLAGGIPGEVPGFDLSAFVHRNTGLVYRNVLVDRIRRAGQVTARCDGRLAVGEGGGAASNRFTAPTRPDL